MSSKKRRSKSEYYSHDVAISNDLMRDQKPQNKKRKFDHCEPIVIEFPLIPAHICASDIVRYIQQQYGIDLKFIKPHLAELSHEHAELLLSEPYIDLNGQRIDFNILSPQQHRLESPATFQGGNHYYYMARNRGSGEDGRIHYPIWIGYVPKATTRAHIVQTLSVYGSVLYVFILFQKQNSYNCAFVDFASPGAVLALGQAVCNWTLKICNKFVKGHVLLRACSVERMFKNGFPEQLARMVNMGMLRDKDYPLYLRLSRKFNFVHPMPVRDSPRFTDCNGVMTYKEYLEGRHSRHVRAQLNGSTTPKHRPRRRSHTKTDDKREMSNDESDSIANVSELYCNGKPKVKEPTARQNGGIHSYRIARYVGRITSFQDYKGAASDLRRSVADNKGEVLELDKQIAEQKHKISNIDKDSEACLASPIDESMKRLTQSTESVESKIDATIHEIIAMENTYDGCKDDLNGLKSRLLVLQETFGTLNEDNVLGIDQLGNQQQKREELAAKEKEASNKADVLQNLQKECQIVKDRHQTLLGRIETKRNEITAGKERYHSEIETLQEEYMADKLTFDKEQMQHQRTQSVLASTVENVKQNMKEIIVKQTEKDMVIQRLQKRLFLYKQLLDQQAETRTDVHATLDTK